MLGGNSGTWGDNEAPKSEAQRAENRGRGRGGVLGEGAPPARGSGGAL